jgi:hypothetical protein
MVLGKLDFTYRRLKLDFTHRRLKLDPSFSSFLSLNSKWIKHLNPFCDVRCEIASGKNKENTEPHRHRLGNNFMNRTLIAQQLREWIDKWDCMELKSSAQQRKWSPN